MFPSQRCVSRLPETGELPAWAAGLLAAARHIEESLPEPVTVQDMAGAAGYPRRRALSWSRSRTSPARPRPWQ